MISAIERADLVSPNLGIRGRYGPFDRKKRKTEAVRKKKKKEDGREKKAASTSEIGNEWTRVRHDGRAGREQWHLTLSESSCVHCSPLILVLAVALSNGSIGGSRRFERSLYFPVRLLYLRTSLSVSIGARWEREKKKTLSPRSNGSRSFVGEDAVIYTRGKSLLVMARYRRIMEMPVFRNAIHILYTKYIMFRAICYWF